MKDFNFKLFRVLRGSTLRFDGSPSQYLIFYSNLSGRGVDGQCFDLFINYTLSFNFSFLLRPFLEILKIFIQET